MSHKKSQILEQEIAGEGNSILKPTPEDNICWMM